MKDLRALQSLAVRAYSHHPEGRWKGGLLFVTQGPKVPRDGLSHAQSAAALHRPIPTTFLLEREEHRAMALWEPTAGISSRAVHNGHSFWVLTQNDKRLQIHAEKIVPC